VTTAQVEPLGRALIVAGLVIAVVGVVMVLGPRIPILGNLPGDIRIERGNATIIIPLGTMLLVSIIASVVLSLLNRR
jgi:membrane associated rhomboid family serine protease